MQEIGPRALASMVLLIAVATGGGLAEAGTSPTPDKVIDASNVSNFASQLSPSLTWIVEHGANLKLGNYRKAALPKLLLEATARYSRLVKLDASAQLQDYVAGLPFARVNPADPQAAAKLVLNYEAAGAVDDLQINPIECDTGKLGQGDAPVQVEQHFFFQGFRRLFYVGRLQADPKPLLEPNRDSLRYREWVQPIVEPFDLKGNSMWTQMPLAAGKEIQAWLYLPSQRRVRRIPEPQRSTAQLLPDIDPDSYAGFAGPVSRFEWRLLGEKTMLSPFHGDSMPVRWSPPPGNYLPDVAWEPRRVWIVEGKPLIPEYAYSKRVLYLDQETYRILSSDLYDGGGELWKSWVGSFLFKDQPDGVTYLPSVTMVDMRSAHVTYCSVPGREAGTPGSWRINTGESREGCYEAYTGIASPLDGCGFDRAAP